MTFPPAPERTRERESASAPSLAGELSHVTASDVLQLVGYLGLSGVLEFERASDGDLDRVRFQVCRGRVVDAHCTGPHLRLGELLVRRYSVALEAVLSEDENIFSQSLLQKAGLAKPQIDDDDD